MSAVITSAVGNTSNSIDRSRYNFYSTIHKAMRGFMSDTLLRVGRVDVADPCEVAQLVEQLRGLMAFCRSHIKHENHFVHPALERAQPYASTRTADEHVDHLMHIGVLERHIDTFEKASVAERALLVHQLYLDLSEFVAENFEHMKMEETLNYTILTRHYTDQELLTIEGAIVASIPPPELMVGMRWLLGHINAGERAVMLGGMQRMAPPAVFAGVLDLAREVLSERDFYKLSLSLN
jgi:hypothetical protein